VYQKNIKSLNLKEFTKKLKLFFLVPISLLYQGKEAKIQINFRALSSTQKGFSWVLELIQT